MKTIVVITDADMWERARKNGQYTHSTLDTTLEEVGFIHCSSPHQTMEIVNRRFADRENLILLFIDADKVAAPVKFERALSGRAGVFPHIYGPLNLDAVYATARLEKNGQGEFVAPKDLADMIG